MSPCACTPDRRHVRRIPVAALALALVALTAAAVPNDPLVGQQPYLGTVRAYEAWDVRRGEGAVVAVLDTGVDLDHPDLVGRLVDGIDLIERDTPPDDPQGHGTIVAGIIAATADNGRGVAGVAPQAMVMPIRVLDEQGRGTSEVVAEGIRFAVTQQVDVINLSLAEVKSDQGVVEIALVADRDVQDAIAEAAAAGIVVVAAAGNDGVPTTPYGADAPVIVVGASTPDDVRWEKSNHDARTLFAPGTDITSTWLDARYANADGTSFATPVVAAGAALLASADLPPEEVTQRLLDSAVDIGMGLGRVDLAAAVQGVAPAPAPTATPIPPPSPPPPESPPPPVDPAPTAPPVEGLEVVVPVQEVLGPPPAQVTEAPPPIATIPFDAGGQDPSPVPSPAATPTPRPAPTPAPRPAVTPTPAATTTGTTTRTAAPLQVEGSDVSAASRSTLIPVATAILGIDLALAAWVVRRRD